METHNLRKVYKEAEALKGLSLTVRQHSIFGFLCPKGASKPTSSRILATITDSAGRESTDAPGVVPAGRFRFCRTYPET